MTIYYSTKDALTLGIFEFSNSGTKYEHSWLYSRLGKDIFTSLKDAEKDAMKRAQKSVNIRKEALQRAQEKLNQFKKDGIPLEK